MKNFYHLNPTKKPQSASQPIAVRFCQNTSVLFKNATSGIAAVSMMVWMLLALSLPTQELSAQPVGSPCHAVRWSEGGHWTGVGSNGCGVNDAPNAPQPQGVVRCANAADTESGIDPNTTYNAATFQIVPGSCVDPDDFSPATVNAPFSGQKLSWFNFDVRPYAGLYDFQTIATGSYELNWALYADTLTATCGTGTDDLSGSCGGTLLLLSCGIDFNGWAPQPFITPVFDQPTNLYLAVWRRGATNSSNDAFDFTFKARYGCGDFCFTQLFGPDSVRCNPNGTYTVRQNINATNTTVTVTAPGNSGIVYSHTPFTFTTASASPAVNTGWVEVTFPASVNNYSITFTPSTEANSDYCDILNVTGVAPVCCTVPTCSTTGPSTVCPSSVTEICAPAGATGYAWSITGGGTITGAANQQCVTVTASNTCNTSYTLTLILGSGACTSTCMKTVTVLDNSAPVLAAAPANVTVECVANVPPNINLGWTDNCSAGGTVPGVTGPLVGGACGGTITRTWNVSDPCGNPAVTRTQVITVDDNTNPVLGAAPANVSVECLANVPPMINLNWTDNCSAGGSVPGVDGPLTGGACGGTITRTWNVMDACGNAAITRTQTITVDDNTAPVLGAAPANVTVECLANVPPMGNLNWTDNCSAGGSVAGVQGPLTGGACGGTITRTWNVMDPCGNPAITRTQVITVDDNTNPVLATAPANVTVSCLADVPLIGNLSYTDNCSPGGIVAGVQGPLVGGACGGTINRTWTATDACGNSASRTQTITVDDNTPPVITTEEHFLDTLLNCDDLDGLIEALGHTPTATDNCDPSPTISLTSTELVEGVCIQAYVLFRNWVFKDDCNNVSDTFTQRIAIVNLNLPQFTLVPTSYSIPCTQTAVFAEPQGTAFCDGTPLITEDRDTFPGVEPGSIIIVRTFMINDLCGNFNPEPQQQTITILPDNFSPSALQDLADAIAGQEIVVQVLDNDSDNSALDTATLEIITGPLHGTATVNPDGTISYTPDEGFAGLDSLEYQVCDDALYCLLLCDNAIVVFAVVDIDADPDSATTCVDFHIDVNVLLNDTASVGTEIDPTTLKILTQPAHGTATANLDSTITYIPDLGFQGIDTITYVICDTNILMPACDTTILVVTTRDTTAPMIICPATISPIECPAVPEFGIVTATDECDTMVVLTVLNDSIPGLCPQEYTLTKTWTATDDAGNTATCVQTIEVVAVTPPVCATQDITITTDIVEGYVLITAEDIDNGSTDNCGPVMLSISQDSFTCADEGLNLVTLTVTDLCGNTSTCTAIVTVEECFDPCVRVNAWVYLEGATTDPNGQPVNTVPMRTTLNDLQVLPGQTLVDPFFGNKYTPKGQPFLPTPWAYPGLEGDLFDSGGDPMIGDAGYPSSVVDWVLVSVRADSAGTGGPLCQAAALLHSNGYIDFVDTFECCDLNFLDSFYIVIEHRNHLIVMSDVKLPIIPGVDSSYMTYNFTTQQSYVDDPFGFGVFGQKEIQPGVWAMFAGNGDQILSGQSDTDINFDDRSFWEQQNGEIGEYFIGDYNLNGDTNFNDRVTWERNNGVFTSVPRE